MERGHCTAKAIGVIVGRRRQCFLSRLSGAALGVALCAAYTLGTVLPAAAAPTSGPLGAGPVAGAIFVANAGANAQGAGGTGPGSITVYRPGATGDARPETVITKGVDGPGGMAVDASGNLWVANEATGKVTEYGRAALAKASPVPTVTISVGVGGLAFDPAGDLWGDNGTTVVKLAKSELDTSGSPGPRLTISPSSNCSDAFDASGDLWLGSDGTTLSEWAPAQLTKSGSPAPMVTISSSSLNEPCKPAFDQAGDLWAGNYDGDTVVEFTKVELARSGSLAPKVTLSSQAIDSPGDVAIDRADDLWVPSAGTNTVIGFTKNQLAKSGSPAPAFNIAGPATGLNWPWAIAAEP